MKKWITKKPSKYFEDKRGYIYSGVFNSKFNILFTKKGYFRSGDYHPNIQHDYVVSGKVKVYIKGEHPIIVKSNEFLSINPYFPHLFYFLEDTLMIEWWKEKFKARYYKPYRKIIKA